MLTEAEMWAIAEKVTMPLKKMVATKSMVLTVHEDGSVAPTVMDSFCGSNAQPMWRDILTLVKQKATGDPRAIIIYHPIAPQRRLIVALSTAGRLQYMLGDDRSKATWTTGCPTMLS